MTSLINVDPWKMSLLLAVKIILKLQSVIKKSFEPTQIFASTQLYPGFVTIQVHHCVIIACNAYGTSITTSSLTRGIYFVKLYNDFFNFYLSQSDLHGHEFTSTDLELKNAHRTHTARFAHKSVAPFMYSPSKLSIVDTN